MYKSRDLSEDVVMALPSWFKFCLKEQNFRHVFMQLHSILRDHSNVEIKKTKEMRLFSELAAARQSTTVTYLWQETQDGKSREAS